MLKKIKLKNSTIIYLGFVLVFIGLFLSLFHYFELKKDKSFSEMNLLLYESEIPENIEEESVSDVGNITITDEQEENNNINNNTQSNVQTINYIGTINIPKIGVNRGFLDVNSPYNNVDYNVTVIKGSTFPDEENNNLILAAHSGNCSYCYFDKLYKLAIGDTAYINYKGIKYEYKIVNIYEVEKTGKISIHRDYNKNTLTLITCTRNSSTKQTVYILELV